MLWVMGTLGTLAFIKIDIQTSRKEKTTYVLTHESAVTSTVKKVEVTKVKGLDKS